MFSSYAAAPSVVEGHAPVVISSRHGLELEPEPERLPQGTSLERLNHCESQSGCQYGAGTCPLPAPSLEAHPDNVVQLLGEEQSAEKLTVQALWCGDEDILCPSSVIVADEWRWHLERLEAGHQPEWREALEMFTVPAVDPRLGLVGQRAVRARSAAAIAATTEAQHVARGGAVCQKSDADGAEGLATVAVIPSGSVLLHYAGSVRSQDEFDERYTAQQARANGWTLLLAGVPPGPLLFLDAYDGGNLSCFINDFRPNPYNDPATAKALQATDVTTTKPNVQFAKVVHLGWPYMFIVSTRTILPGEELLL
eukprot:COSAG02_NODE_12693_length_1508_cov_8.245564_1_plen_310_part_00